MTDGVTGRTRVLGSLRSADGAGVVRIEDRYDTDIDDLWSALVDPQRIVRWYGQVEGDLRLGGHFTLYVPGAGIHALGQVEACEPPRHLRVTTRETDESAVGGEVPPFDQTIEATLTGEDGQTVLVIEARGMPVDKIAFYGAGWQIHAENLATYLDNYDRADAESRWTELVPAYQDLAARIV